MKRIGIFAGTFNPVHKGHIEFCRATIKECDLDKVFLLPERQPRSKQNVTDFSHRVALAELALDQSPNLGILTLDETQFTVATTLPSLQAAFPGAELTFLIGSDVACGSLQHWEQLDTLLEQASLAVAIRYSDSPETVRQAMERLKRTHPALRYTVVETAHAHVSSSQIRISGTGLEGEQLRYSRLNSLYGL